MKHVVEERAWVNLQMERIHLRFVDDPHSRAGPGLAAEGLRRLADFHVGSVGIDVNLRRAVVSALASLAKPFSIPKVYLLLESAAAARFTDELLSLLSQKKVKRSG